MEDILERRLIYRNELLLLNCSTVHKQHVERNTVVFLSRSDYLGVSKDIGRRRSLIQKIQTGGRARVQSCAIGDSQVVQWIYWIGGLLDCHKAGPLSAKLVSLPNFRTLRFFQN